MNMIKEVDTFCENHFKKGKFCRSSNPINKNKLCKYSKHFNTMCKFKWLEEKYKNREAKIKRAIEECQPMGFEKDVVWIDRNELKQKLFKE